MSCFPTTGQSLVVLELNKKESIAAAAAFMPAAAMDLSPWRKTSPMMWKKN